MIKYLVEMKICVAIANTFFGVGHNVVHMAFRKAHESSHLRHLLLKQLWSIQRIGAHASVLQNNKSLKNKILDSSQTHK